MKCPKCGDNLIYNPKNKLLKCDSCSSFFKVVTEEKHAPKVQKAGEESVTTEDGFYIKYTCALCGAELLGTYETSAIGFCPYCGSESILSSKLDIVRPDKIIPFNKTKEECIEEYKTVAGRIPFLPEEFRYKGKTKEVRGIYVPFTIYHMKHIGSISAGYKTGTGKYTVNHIISGDVNAEIEIPIDASNQLPDNTGIMTFPYDKNAEEEFNENYLATYYIEIPNVNHDEYMPELKEETIYWEIKALSEIYETNCTNISTLEANHVECVKTETVLVPLYFLTYKDKNNISYAIISGHKSDNKKVYIETPVDITGYVLKIPLIAGIIYAIMRFLFNVSLNSHLILLILNSINVFGLYFCSSLYRLQVLKYNDYTYSSKSTDSNRGNVLGTLYVVYFLFMMRISNGNWISSLNNNNIQLYILLSWIFIIIGITLFKTCCNYIKEYDELSIATPFLFLLSIIALCVIDTFLINAASITPVLQIITGFFTLFDIVLFYNLLSILNDISLRPIPHFNREGGHNETKDI